MSTSALNPNVVLTALDDLFFPVWNRDSHPQHASAENALVFKQESSDRSAEVLETHRGVTLWDSKSESQNAPADTWQAVNQTTFTNVTYAKTIDLPKEYFDDDQHTQVRRGIQEMARKGRWTQDFNAFAVYRNAFTTAGGDGVALVNDAHPVKNGGTVDNRVASDAVLSETSLNTAITQAWQLSDQSNELAGFVPTVLLVPPALYKTAVEITESELRSATADNDANVYSDKYGIRVLTSPYLGAGATGGSDTAWFVLGPDHGVMRFVREPLTTHLLDWKETRNHNYAYTGRFREVYGFADWAGIVGSDGTND